jgi:hypothetical protein
MSMQAHPGFGTVGIDMPRATRRSTVSDGRLRIGRRTLKVVAAVAIDLLAALTFVALSVGIGGEPRAAGTRPDAVQFVTPAPEAPPTPRPSFDD